MRGRIYSAGLVSQSFWFVETKKILGMLFNGSTKHEIKTLCVDHNLFGMTRSDRAERMFGCIWNRIARLDSDLIKIFNTSSLATQKILNLMSIVEGDKLFFEFLFEVYREKVIVGISSLKLSDVSIFFKDKEVQSPILAGWTDATKLRLGSAYLTMLAEANMLAGSGRVRNIVPPILDATLEHYLRTAGKVSIIKAFTGEC